MNNGRHTAYLAQLGPINGRHTRNICNVSGVLVWIVVACAAGVAGLVIGAIGGRRYARRIQTRVPALVAPTISGPLDDAAVAALPGLILEVLGHGVVVVDRDERVVIANPAAETMGVTAGDRLTIAELSELVHTATGGETAIGSVDLPPRAGRGPLAVSATAVPLTDGAARSRVAAVVLLLDDVTEQRRLEAVRRDFVANVSHELKTPVGALTLLAEAILGAADDPEAVQRFAGRMQHEGTRLGRLVRELIELSRLQGAEPLPGTQQVSVTQLVEEAADRTRLAAESAGIVVRLSVATDLAVRGNETQLAMAVANLIDNGVAYSTRGTRVAVSARSVEDAGQDWVEISVSDQGIGIAENDQNRVFERFYRVDPARSRATGGTGLGLAIVKHVATNHGGTVSVWSAEGAGSTFTIRLPRVHEREGSSQPEPASDRPALTTMVKGSA
jgi:two-component system sensor histidine kinase SenX3